MSSATTSGPLKESNRLANSVANVLLDRYEATSIKLFSQERSIPFPEEVLDGLKLNSTQLLLPLNKIGELDANGYRAANRDDPQNPEGSNRWKTDLEDTVIQSGPLTAFIHSWSRDWNQFWFRPEAPQHVGRDANICGPYRALHPFHMGS